MGLETKKGFHLNEYETPGILIKPANSQDSGWH